MLNKTIGLFLVIVFFLGVTPQFAFGKQKGNWEQLKNQVNNEVALKTESGETIYGKLVLVNDTELGLQTADKQTLASQTTTIQKSSIKKVWKAQLRFKPTVSGKNVAIGAAAGGGAAIGIGFGLLFLGTDGPANRDAIFAGIIAAGIGGGAALGYFLGKKGHKKLDLIYEP